MDHQHINHALYEHLKLSTMSCSTRCSLAVLKDSCGAMGRKVRRLQGRIRRQRRRRTQIDMDERRGGAVQGDTSDLLIVISSESTRLSEAWIAYTFSCRALRTDSVFKSMLMPQRQVETASTCPY